MNKLKRFLFGILYGLPFGMKIADDKIMHSEEHKIGGNISQSINQGNVYDNLIKGEVTQEVKELRYKSYLVENESRNYKYNGIDRGIKIFNNNFQEENLKFQQKNGILTASVFDELQRIDEYSQDKFIITIITEDFPLFKLERYLDFINVDINSKEKNYKLTLAYSKWYDKTNIRHKVLCKMLSKGLQKKSDATPYIKSLTFVTNKVENIPDFTKYTFLNLKPLKIYDDNSYYYVEYEADKCEIINLIEKYFNKEVDEKYKNKESKNIVPQIIIKDKNICCDCLKQINDFEEKISKEKVGKKLCLNCLSKYVVN